MTYLHLTVSYGYDIQILYYLTKDTRRRFVFSITYRARVILVTWKKKRISLMNLFCLAASLRKHSQVFTRTITPKRHY